MDNKNTLIWTISAKRAVRIVIIALIGFAALPAKADFDLKSQRCNDAFIAGEARDAFVLMAAGGLCSALVIPWQVAACLVVAGDNYDNEEAANDAANAECYKNALAE